MNYEREGLASHGSGSVNSSLERKLARGVSRSIPEFYYEKSFRIIRREMFRGLRKFFVYYKDLFSWLYKRFIC